MKDDSEQNSTKYGEKQIFFVVFFELSKNIVVETETKFWNSWSIFLKMFNG